MGFVYFPPWNRPLNVAEDDRWIGEDRQGDLMENCYLLHEYRPFRTYRCVRL